MIKMTKPPNVSDECFLFVCDYNAQTVEAGIVQWILIDSEMLSVQAQGTYRTEDADEAQADASQAAEDAEDANYSPVDFSC